MLLQDLNLDDSASEPVSIPVHDVRGPVLELVIDWLVLHKDDAVMTVKPRASDRHIIADKDRAYTEVCIEQIVLLSFENAVFIIQYGAF